MWGRGQHSDPDAESCGRCKALIPSGDLSQESPFIEHTTITQEPDTTNMHTTPCPDDFLLTTAGDFLAAFKLLAAIPSLAVGWLRPAKATTKADEQCMRRFERVCDLDDDDGMEDDIVDDDLGPTPWDRSELATVEEGHNGRAVKRTRRISFMKKMVWWAKGEFPGMVHSHTTADEEVLRLALTRHMRGLNVRNKDVVALLPLIVMGVFLPTSSDVAAARMRATHAAERAFNKHKGWTPAAPWWRFWSLGRGGWAPKVVK